MTKLVGLIGRELAPARGVEDDVGVAAIDRGITHPARGGGWPHSLGLAGRRGAFLRRRLRIGVGGQESGNKEERCGKQGEAGRDATERGCHRNYAITKVYIFVPMQRLRGSSSTVLKFVGLCNFLPAALMPKLA